MGFHLRNRWWHDSQRNGSPSIQEHQCFELWNSEKKRDTIHIRADASNNGAVACWCEEFGQMANETEPTSERFVAKENVQLLKNVKRKKEILLVQTPRSDDPAFGN